MASPPTPQALLGPYYFGTILNTFLFGILVLQIIYYYQAFKKDKLWLRCLVLYLLVVETLNTAMTMAMIYEPLVAQFGTSSPMFLFPSLLPSRKSCPNKAFKTLKYSTIEPFLEAAIFVPVQFFYAWRIFVIMQNWVIPTLIGMTSLTAMVGAIWTAIVVIRAKNYGNKSEVDLPALIWSCCASAADLIITVSLFWSLTRRKTGLKRTDDIIDAIARHAVQTGLLTATCSIIDVTLFVALPNSTLSFFFDFGLPKLYSNALVSTLNARNSPGHTDGGIIELETPTALYTGSSYTRQTTTTRRSGSIVFNQASVQTSTHKLAMDNDDILGLGTGDYTDPK